MSDLTGLLERAMYDIRQGWPEAAHDAIGRALRIAVRAEVLEAENLAERVQALEKQAANATKTPLAELNEFRRSESQRLDEAIKAILAKPFPGWRCSDWPTIKEVWKALRADAFYPLPKVRTVGLHLLKVRGSKRQHTVMSQTEASASRPPAIIQATNRRT